MEIIKALKRNPIADYRKYVTPLLNKLWNNYASEAIALSIEAISKGEPFSQPFIDAAEQTANDAEKMIAKYTKAIWNNGKQLVQKDNLISFNQPDTVAINLLIKGQLAWIKDHGNKSDIAKLVSEEYGRLWGEGNTRSQTVAALVTKFADVTPANFAAKFGEQKYWELFTQHHSTLTGSFASINRLKKRKTYRYYARNDERTCPICGYYHDKVFEVAPAAQDMSNYMTAAQSGDVEAMKTARPFTTDTNSDRPVPPLHINCQCRLLFNLEELT